MISDEYGVGTKHKIVNFETADRSGIVFESYIYKYMIPNVKNPTCTRELKERVIQSYAKSIGWKKYETAIGIRVDEIDRVSSDRINKRLLYPLIQMVPMSKIQINTFWEKMPFRLNLKGYQGNCKTCWKKSFRKLATIAMENPEAFDFFKRMEYKYSSHIPERKKRNAKIKPPINFFRGNRNVSDIFKMIYDPNFRKAEDDSIIYLEDQMVLQDGTELDLSNGCSESCEVFTV